MKIWVITYNDDNGVSAQVFYSEAEADKAATKWLKQFQESYPSVDFSNVDTDQPWRVVFNALCDQLGFMDSITVEAVDLDLGKFFPNTTRADLAQFGECKTDSSGNPCVWLNEYTCGSCGSIWNDRHSCQCDDRCPSCNRSNAPHTSTFCADVTEPLADLWSALLDAK